MLETQTNDTTQPAGETAPRQDPSDDAFKANMRDVAREMREQYQLDDDSAEDSTSESLSVDEQPTADEKPKTAKERAQAKLDQRKFEREARAERTKREALEKEVNDLKTQLGADAFSKIGGREGAIKLIDEINAGVYDDKIKTPEQEAIDELKAKLSRFEEKETEREKAEREAQERQGIESDNKVITDWLAERADKYPALAAMGTVVANNIRHTIYERMKETGEQPSPAEIDELFESENEVLIQQATPLFSSAPAVVALIDRLPADVQAQIKAALTGGRQNSRANGQLVPGRKATDSEAGRTDEARRASSSTVTASDRSQVTSGFKPSQGNDDEVLREQLRSWRNAYMND